MRRHPGKNSSHTVYDGAAEVSSAILTAVSTTIVSFIPVFTMQAAEGKLFGPLAFTKTFALVAALIVSLIFLPAFAHWVFGAKNQKEKYCPMAEHCHYSTWNNCSFYRLCMGRCHSDCFWNFRVTQSNLWRKRN